MSDDGRRAGQRLHLPAGQRRVQPTPDANGRGRAVAEGYAAPIRRRGRTMTELTPSAVLLAAADRVRDLAADTTHPRPNGHGWSLLADDGESDAWEPDWSTVLSCAGSGGEHPIAVDVRVGDARWIAALSPAIAPHLETWLRSTASRLEAWLPTGWPIREDEAAALRFALAILGKTAEEVDAAARQAEGSGVEAP